jgi:hypothetical protein
MTLPTALLITAPLLAFIALWLVLARIAGEG